MAKRRSLEVAAHHVDPQETTGVRKRLRDVAEPPAELARLLPDVAERAQEKIARQNKPIALDRAQGRPDRYYGRNAGTWEKKPPGVMEHARSAAYARAHGRVASPNIGEMIRTELTPYAAEAREREQRDSTELSGIGPEDRIAFAESAERRARDLADQFKRLAPPYDESWPIILELRDYELRLAEAFEHAREEQEESGERQDGLRELASAKAAVDRILHSVEKLTEARGTAMKDPDAAPLRERIYQLNAATLGTLMATRKNLDAIAGSPERAKSTMEELHELAMQTEEELVQLKNLPDEVRERYENVAKRELTAFVLQDLRALQKDLLARMPDINSEYAQVEESELIDVEDETNFLRGVASALPETVKQKLPKELRPWAHFDEKMRKRAEEDQAIAGARAELKAKQEARSAEAKRARGAAAPSIETGVGELTKAELGKEGWQHLSEAERGILSGSEDAPEIELGEAELTKGELGEDAWKKLSEGERDAFREQPIPLLTREEKDRFRSDTEPTEPEFKLLKKISRGENEPIPLLTKEEKERRRTDSEETVPVSLSETTRPELLLRKPKDNEPIPLLTKEEKQEPAYDLLSRNQKRTRLTAMRAGQIIQDVEAGLKEETTYANRERFDDALLDLSRMYADLSERARELKTKGDLTGNERDEQATIAETMFAIEDIRHRIHDAFRGIPAATSPENRAQYASELDERRSERIAAIDEKILSLLSDAGVKHPRERLEGWLSRMLHLPLNVNQVDVDRVREQLEQIESDYLSRRFSGPEHARELHKAQQASRLLRIPQNATLYELWNLTRAELPYAAKTMEAPAARKKTRGPEHVVQPKNIVQKAESLGLTNAKTIYQQLLKRSSGMDIATKIPWYIDAMCDVVVAGRNNDAKKLGKALGSLKILHGEFARSGAASPEAASLIRAAEQRFKS